MVKFSVKVSPLSVNKAWKGRRFKTKECKVYCEEVLLKLPKVSVHGFVDVKFVFHIKNFAMADGDNLVKTFADCLVNKGIIDDDRFIIRYVIEKAKVATYDEEFVEVEITPNMGTI